MSNLFLMTLGPLTPKKSNSWWLHYAFKGCSNSGVYEHPV